MPLRAFANSTEFVVESLMPSPYILKPLPASIMAAPRDSAKAARIAKPFTPATAAEAIALIPKEPVAPAGPTIFKPAASNFNPGPSTIAAAVKEPISKTRPVITWVATGCSSIHSFMVVIIPLIESISSLFLTAKLATNKLSCFVIV